MANFDVDSYLNDRFASVGPSKLAELDKAREDKISGLQKFRDNITANSVNIIAEKQAEADSWVGQAGLEADSLAGSAVNLAASAYAGVSRMAGHAAGIPKAIESAYYNATLNSTDTEAFNRLQQGEATAEDQVLLNQKEIAPGEFLNAEDYAVAVANGARDRGNSKLELFNKAIAARKVSRDVVDAFDRSSVVHQGNRKPMNEAFADGSQFALDETKQGWQDLKDGNVASGVGNMVAGVAQLLVHAGGVAANNKMGVAEYVAENAPQLLLGVFGKAGAAAQAMTNVGYASDYYQQGMEAYQAKHGVLPSAEEQNSMALKAASLAAAEQFGDRAGVGLMKSRQALGKVTGAAEQPLSRAGFKESLLGVTKAVTGGIASEAPTEGYQTYMEGEILGKPASALDIYTGAAIGGLSGGALSGGGRAVSEVTGATPEAAERRVDARKQVADFDALAKTNDTTALLDPEAKTYDPLRAVAVMATHANLEDTPEEVKLANLVKAREVVQTVQAAHDRNVDLIDRVSIPSEVQLAKDELVSKKAELSATDPANVHKIVSLTKEIQFREEVVALSGDNRAFKRLANEVKRTQQQLSNTKEVQETLAERIRSKISVEEVATHVKVATRSLATDDMPDFETSRKSAQALVNLSMVSPTDISIDVANTLVNNKGSVLTDSERAYFRQFTEARIAENKAMDLGKVTEAVLLGRGKDIGIAGYRKTLGQAFEIKDKTVADRSLGELASFAESHQAKAEIASKLFEKVRHSGDKQVLKVKGGGWEVQAGKWLSKNELAINGGFEIHPNSIKFVEAVTAEAAALTAVAKAQSAAYALTFGTSAPVSIPVAPSTNVSTNQAKVDTSVKPVQKPAESVQVTPVTPTVPPVAQTTAVAPVVPAVESKQPPQTPSKTLSVTEQAEGELRPNQTDERTPELSGKVDPDSQVAGTTSTQQEKGNSTVSVEAEQTAGVTETTEKAVTPIADRLSKEDYNGLDTVESVDTFLQEAYTLWKTGSKDPVVQTRLDNMFKAGGYASTDLAGFYDGLSGGNAELKHDALLQQLKITGDTKAESIDDGSFADQDLSSYSNEYQDPSLDSLEFEIEQADMADLQDKHKDRKFRVLTAEERKILNLSKAKLEKVFGKELAALKHFFIQENVAAKAGTNFGVEKIIGLSPEIFTALREGIDDTVEDRVTRILAHELAHARDFSGAKLVDMDYVYPSRTYPSLNAAKGTNPIDQVSFPFDGSIYQAAKASMEKSPVLAAWFGFIMDGRTAPHKIPSELYAQLYSLYLTKPELMNEETGLARAYQAIAGDIEFHNQESSAKTQPIDNGRTAPSVGENSTPDTRAEEEDASVRDTEGLPDVTEEITGPFPGALAALHAVPKSTPDVSYKKRNLLVDHFTQAVAGVTAASKRPLVMVRDFMGAVNKTVKFTDYLGNEKLSEKQESALNFFGKLTDDWAKPLQNLLVHGYIRPNGTWNEDRDHFFKNPFNWLITNTDGVFSIEDNTNTAMVYGALTTLMELADAPATSNDATINAILGRDPEAAVPEFAKEKLDSVGTRINLVRSSSGKTPFAALGLKANKDAGQDLEARLQGGMGTLIVQLLLDQKLATAHTVTADEMNSITALTDAIDNKEGAKASPATRENQIFITIARDEKGELTPEVKAILEAMKGSGNVLDKLFSVETQMVYPTFAAAENTQSSTKTGQAIPNILNEVNDQNRAQANYARKDMWKLLNIVTPEIAGAMAGVETITEEGTQKTKQRGIKAKNDGLWRELNRYHDYMQDILLPSPNGIEQGIHLDYSVWLQQRVGIATNVINPQTSKAHRALFFRDSWESQVEIHNLDMLDNFFMRVGEGFGVKTERDTMDADLKKTHEKLDDPVVHQAIKDLQTVLYSAENLTEKELQALLAPEQQANLLAAVKLGGTNFHTLDALVAMAHYYQALDTGAESFITHLQAEVDGVTNGPILAHALFGAALVDPEDSSEGTAAEKAAKQLNETVARGGIYTKESEYGSFPVWKSDPANKDLYENTTAAIIQGIMVSVAETFANARGKKQEQIDSVYFFTGSLDKDDGNVSSAGRTFIKGPVTKMVYGEGIGKALRGMGENFIGSVYDVMEKSANGDPAFPPELVQMHLNRLLSVDKSLGQLKTTDFNKLKMNPAGVAALKKAFAKVVNKPVATVIKSHFAGFAARRDAFNKAAGFTHALYTSVYDAMRIQLIEQLMDVEAENLAKAAAGETDVDFNKGIAFRTVQGKRESLRDLSKNEERELEKAMSRMLPVMQTLFSIESKQPKAGLRIGKMKQKFSSNPAYKTDVRYKDKNGQHITVVNNLQTSHEAPGVSMLPLVIQSIDSYISHRTQQGMELLNIHDAVIAGLKTIGAASVKMNESTFHALLNYSPMLEMYNAMQHTVMGLNSLVRTTNEKGEWLLGDPVAESLAAGLGQFAVDNNLESASIAEQLQAAYRAAVEAEKVKLTAMKQWAYVNQYAHENSSYEVTPEDLALIEKKLASLSEEMPAKALLAANNIEEKMGQSLERAFDSAFKGKESLTDDMDDTVTSSATPTSTQTYSTHDIYNALAQNAVSSSFDTHLKDVLTNIVEKLHGAFGSFKASVMKDTPKTALDIYSEALAAGDAPYAFSLGSAWFDYSAQQSYVADQVHATMLKALESNSGQNAAVYSELGKLFRETRARLQPKDFYEGDWATALPHEVAKVTALYNRVFNELPTGTEERSNYLAEFAALGLTHEKFNKLLQVPTKMAPPMLQDKTIAGMLGRLFSKVLEFFNGKITHTVAGQNADEKLKALVTRLVEIENKRVLTLNAERGGFMKFMDKQAQSVRMGKKSAVSKLARSSMFMKNKNVFIASASGVVATLADSQVGLFFRNIDTIRNEHFSGRQSIITGFLSEMNGPKPVIQGLLRAVKYFEGQRKKIITQTNKFVLQAFDNQGKDLEDFDKRAITKVLLHTGAHVLLDQPGFDTQKLEALLKDPTALAQEIAVFETKLNQYTPTQKGIFVEQSRALGFYLVTGKVTHELMLKNASNIAHMHSLGQVNTLTKAALKEATATIDALTSLYALSYTNSANKTSMVKTLAQEHARTDGGNGVRLVLLSHKEMENQSRERLFSGSNTLMVKGYVSEIYNPHTDIKVANGKEGRVLEDLGYIKGAMVGNDPTDKGADAQHLYVMKDGGSLPWLSGIFSFTGMNAKGSKHHGAKAYRMQQSITQDKLATMQARPASRSGTNFDPTRVTQNHMAPLLNDTGVAVNYQYLMQSDTKDDLLERDTRFDSVMGALNGSIFDKENSADHNRKAVQVMFDEFDKGYNKEPKAYLRVSETSQDPELREIYKMLPKATKDAIREIWGKDEMLVRANNLDIAFGYRKRSLSVMFDKDEEDRDFAEKTFIWWSEAILKTTAMAFVKKDGKRMTRDEAEHYAKRAAVFVRRGENVWQELVKETKDIFVIKSGITAIANIVSNMTLLKLYGVSNVSALRDMRIAWVGAQDYARDTERLFTLETQLATKSVTTGLSDIKREIKELKDTIARNPVRTLIEAGLMPTIVEDVSADEDIYAYKSRFVRKTEKYTNKLNKHVVTAGKQLYMAHDTQMYKTMAQLTQLSDFVARYALYQHLTTRKDNPISEKFAIQEASDAFINYDVPMHRDLQYLDDMGLMMFTKYFMRIQRVIRGRFKHAPGKVALLLLAQGYLDWLPTTLDASILFKFGNNPFSWGALSYPGSLDELATVKAGLSLFK